MRTASVADITQEEFDSAVQTVISGIKASDPKLDTRLGTVLRSLLVNPEARLDATTTRQIDYVRQATSLKTMLDAETAGEDVEAEDVNAVLSNFNIKASEGTRASGIVKVVVADGTKTFSITGGTQFKTADGLVFTSTETVVTRRDGTGTTLYEGSAGFFFLVPVIAESVGEAYNIPQGTDLTPDSSVYSFVSAEAYKSFDGGSDIADLQETIDKIPSGLSIRGFVNKSACEGMLRDTFDGGNFPIVACSTVGYGNSAQRRDKHNPFGVGIGGRIDLYIRNFSDLYTVTKIVSSTGKHEIYDDNGNLKQVDYSLTLEAKDFPGSCWVKSIGDISTDVSSPLEFTCKRTATEAAKTWHDINVKSSAAEAFNTIWQGFDVMVHEVPPDGGTSDSSSDNDTWSDERLFQVEVYCLPQATELQEYVDREDVRSVATDVVVRCPVICNVGVTATVVYDPSNPMDETETRNKIRKYINGLGFVGRLTRSEIVHVIKSCGAVSVDLRTNDMLYGVLYDAYGERHELVGDALQVDNLTDDGAMTTSDTVIFAAEAENINLKFIPGK